MNHLMQKSFLIQARNFKEISEGKGYLEYKLVDEKGDTRTVTATAKTGRFRELSQIKAVYKREAPLVNALRKATVNETVFVDFSHFNKKNPRSKLVADSRSPSYKGAYSSYPESIPVLERDNLVRLLGIAVIGFILLMMVKFFI